VRHCSGREVEYNQRKEQIKPREGRDTDSKLPESFHITERQGQRREPATGRARIATRRVGWRPFAGPSSSIKLSGTPAGLSPASKAWPAPDAVAISVWIVVMSGWESVSEGSGVVGGRW
jgi:hypothetical protein